MGEDLKLLSALNLAACWMGGSKDQFQSFCAGFSSGVMACIEALDRNFDDLDPKKRLGQEAAREIMAGAMSIIGVYNEAMEKDAVLEEENQKAATCRDNFRKDAMQNYLEMNGDKMN